MILLKSLLLLIVIFSLYFLLDKSRPNLSKGYTSINEYVVTNNRY